MSTTPIMSVFPVFTDIDGQPLDPQANPQQVYWDQGLTQPATRPIRTIGGYPSNVGAASRIFVGGSYSIRATQV